MLAASIWDRTYLAWHLTAAGLALLMAVLASGHAVLYKRDTRAAIAWVGFIWLAPLAGAVLYFIFGVNRIRRQALFLRSGLERYRAHPVETDSLSPHLPRRLDDDSPHLEMLARVVGNVVEHPLLEGNEVEPLFNGDEAYPAMLEAICQAKKSVTLETYIFDRDAAGLEFVHALGAAVGRGVQVRVLVDAAGLRYSWPSITGALRRARIRHARFLPSMNPLHLVTMNLRTHRKILVTDGVNGFTGGMNIRLGHCLKRGAKRPVQDIHFRVRGPVVTQLQ